jgi:hypothetical protein
VAGHIVFVRFFPGYSDSFPYDRFLGIKGEQIAETVAALCDEWWKNPTNRTRLREARSGQTPEELELRKRQKQWSKAGLARAGRTLGLPKTGSSALEAEAATRKGKPTLAEIAEVEGWSEPSTFQAFPPHQISNRFPLARFESAEHAEMVSDALQVRVAELKDGAFKKTAWRKGDEAVLFTGANPRFTVIGEADLTGQELLVAAERMQRIRRPVSGTPTIEENFVRLYSHELGPTLKQGSMLNTSREVSEVGRTRERTPATGAGNNGNNKRHGGRPRLDDPTATPEQKYRLNAYEIIRKALKPGWGPKALLFHFEPERDFRILVRKAGTEPDVAFYRAALNWIRANPVQETPPENV